MQPSLPTGTVTFLFTDIENSTGMAQRYPGEMPSLLAQHHAILRQAIEANNGHVFLIVGDAFCASFFTAADALQAALSAQRQLQHTQWHPAPIQVRMGVHTGPAQAGTSDNVSGGYSGYLTLTRTQRVMSIAYGGQVLISGATAELLRGELPESVEMRDMGEHRLKGLLNPEHLWQMSASDLLSEFPALSSLNTIPNNLPVQLNSFIGREDALAKTKELLGTTHLLTLIGPGGTGKTRLSLQLAAELLPEFPGGTWLVELAPLADPALVLQTIAATLGLREISGISLKDVVTRFLCEKHLLLILDNCEHLVETCAVLVEHFLRNCSNLKIIASSREALGITGESVFRVPPLILPDSESLALETLRRSEAIQLFVERAAAVRPNFALNTQNVGAVAQICVRLDGIPLALELAAARVKLLTPQQIATRLDDRFQLLTGGSRTALPRQQTLRSLIDWSYDLLSEQERRLFCRLAVFVGGWSLEAAEAICPEMDVLEILGQLVQKSLVAVNDIEGGSATRFHLLETIRQYARDRLLESEGALEARNRHLEYFLNFAATAAQNFYSSQRLEWVDRCELEHDNLRAALQWGLDHNFEAALRMGGALSTFWTARGFIEEGLRWLQAARDRAAATPIPQGEAGRQRLAAQAYGLIGSSQMSYGAGNYQAGLDASQEAAHLFRQLGDRSELAMALCYVGNMAAFQGENALAEEALAEAILIGRETGNKVVLSYALGVLANHLELPRGDFASARLHNQESARHSRDLGLTWAVGQAELCQVRIAALQEQWDEGRASAQAALDIFQGLNDPLLTAMTYSELGDLELRTGNLSQAQSYHEQSISSFQEISQRALVIHDLESFAYIAHRLNKPERTARLLGAAEALRAETGISLVGIMRIEDEYERAIGWLHTQCDETTYNVRWDEGRAMSMDQSIFYALNSLD